MSENHTRRVVNSDKQLRLRMDRQSYLLLKGLMAHYDAATYGEIARRGLQALALCDQIDWEETDDHRQHLPADTASTHSVSVSFRVSARTKALLENIARDENLTYSRVLQRALSLMVHIARESGPGRYPESEMENALEIAHPDWARDPKEHRSCKNNEATQYGWAM